MGKPDHHARNAESILPLLAAWVCGVLLAVAAPQASHAREPAAAVQPAVELQQRRQWVFQADRVTFSNRFEGARLNGVERLGPDRYRLTIAPETTPINPSPWFGFAVFSSTPKRVDLSFHYTAHKARYPPWLSSDGGRSWRKAADRDMRVDAAGEVTLGVDVGPRRLLVSGQRPVVLEDIACWEESLGQGIEIDESDIGSSVLGRPVHMLAFGNPAAKRILLVLGRQHPPETTGSRALMAFIDTLASGSPQAVAFRKQVRILVVPVMNPDGVVEGHWRSNADGKDLNRDWGIFDEPETRAVRDMLEQQVEGRGRTLAFALDFHSTWHDIFYTVTDDPARQPGGALNRWMGAMQARFPGRITESPGKPNVGVFKNWAYTRYAAPSVTYEVGDDTSDQQLGQLAAFAAVELMEVLSENKRAGANR